MVLGGQNHQKHYWCYWGSCLLFSGRAGLQKSSFMAVEILQVCLTSRAAAGGGEEVHHPHPGAGDCHSIIHVGRDSWSSRAAVPAQSRSISIQAIKRATWR